MHSERRSCRVLSDGTRIRHFPEICHLYLTFNDLRAALAVEENTNDTHYGREADQVGCIRVVLDADRIDLGGALVDTFIRLNRGVDSGIPG